MTHNGTQGFDKAYGIFAKENITISEKASVGITCATPSNTAIDASNCNGLRAGKDVTINTTGEVKIDVTKAGKNDAYSIGVYPSGECNLDQGWRYGGRVEKPRHQYQFHRWRHLWRR